MTDESSIPVGRLSGEAVAPIPSASTILARETDDDFEIFMLERHVETEFAAGALVFPGGRVEEADMTLPANRWSGLDLSRAADQFGMEEQAVLGLHVAAVRETFEEAGILIASRDGATVTTTEISSLSYTTARQRLGARDESWDWADWLAAEGLVLDLGALAWWSWWVTPEGVHKRYETWFFACDVPPDQVGVHDRVETVTSRWTTPRAALRAAGDGSVTVVYPTRKSLEALANYGSAADLLSAARTGRVDRRRTCPEIVRTEDGAIMVRHPFTGEIDEP